MRTSMKQGNLKVWKIAAAVLISFGIIGLAIWTTKLPERTASRPADATGKEPASGAPEMSSQRGFSAEQGGAATQDGACCKAGDTTPPTELVKQVPPGGLRSPYPDYAKMAKDDPNIVKQFRLPGCNECHGGTGGGGFCPALSQGVWFWGNTDDVLFRLVTLGSAELEKQGFVRYQWGTVHGPMPSMGATIPTSDQLWKIIAFIRSINPPGANPPEKVIPGKVKAAGNSPGGAATARVTALKKAASRPTP
jgi:mono/diheme cytochrome c family protein